ncbi:MAG: hypothetical protein PHV33_09655 [Elusimicrobiales bacterium]|nr:hypothetical protein [Elusimicrobiales bacterium]
MGRVLLKGFLFAVWALFAFSPKAGASAPAAAVGASEISERDIGDWQAAQACYGADAIVSRRAGFMRLFETAILEELLARRAARPITRADYDRESARIDAETRAPDILACVKKYFGGDARRYERIFVRPILAQRFMREYVKTDPAVQTKAYALRDGALKDIAEKKNFQAIGAGRGLAWSTAAYAAEADTAAPVAPEPWRRWQPYEAAFIEEHLKALKPGEVKAEPIEDEAAIKFVRLIKTEGKKYYFETLAVPKLTTEDYLESVKKLPVLINDKELRDWVVAVKGNPLIAPAEIAPPGGGQQNAE